MSLMLASKWLNVSDIKPHRPFGRFQQEIRGQTTVFLGTSLLMTQAFTFFQQICNPDFAALHGLQI
jgi:hypothetical protein